MAGGWLRSRLRRPVERFRREGRDGLLWTLRLTTVAVASYVVAQVLLTTQRPLLAPLTALLVVQATPVSLLTTGLDRVASVVVGVLLAVTVSVLVPLTWWSLAAVIAASLLLGQALRLRAHRLEVPISAMLVLGVGAAATDVAAWQRVVETLIGAGVGVLANLVLPPKVHYANAAEAVDEVAERLTSLLDRAVEDVSASEGDGERLAAAAQQWLVEVRRIASDIPQVGATLEHVEEGRKLNLRMVRAPNAAPGIRQGLEVLERTVVSLRSMVRAIGDATLDATWPADDSARHAADDLVEVLRSLSRAIAAFGRLVRVEAASAELRAPDRARELQQALEEMQAAAALLFSRGADQNPALAELYVSLGSTVKRVRHELDVDDRVRRQDVLRPARRPVRDVINPRQHRRPPEA